MRLNRRLCLIGGLLAAAGLIGLNGHATALEKVNFEETETIELFPALPTGAEYIPYTPAPSGLPGPIGQPTPYVYSVGYAPVGFDPSCCTVPVCEEICPKDCCDCGKVPYILKFKNPRTGCCEYVKLCIPDCVTGCPTRHFRRTILLPGYGVLTFKWRGGYTVKIKIRHNGDIVVKD